MGAASEPGTRTKKQSDPLSGSRGGSLLNGVLLISGTSIGAGMLALPITASSAGFLPSFFTTLICWLFMMATGLLFLEATLWMEDGANVLSMAKRFLGKTGEIAAGSAFVFLYYCLMTAYIAGGGPLFSAFARSTLNLDLSPGISFWLFGLLLAAVVLMGAKFIARTNGMFMAALAISYFILIGAGMHEVDADHYATQNWGSVLFAAPMLFSAFGFHNIVPSISTYLNRDKKKLRLAIILGTAIPFGVYTAWQWLVIGTVPPELLAEMKSNSKHIGEILAQVTENPWISSLANYFAFFAIITSILGVALSMVDFLGDALQSKRSGLPRAGLTALVFLPSIFVSSGNPFLFVKALGIAGGFGEAFLNGLLPIALVWAGRYHFKLPEIGLLPWGKGFLAALVLFTLIVIGVEAYDLFF